MSPASTHRVKCNLILFPQKETRWIRNSPHAVSLPLTKYVLDRSYRLPVWKEAKFLCCPSAHPTPTCWSRGTNSCHCTHHRAVQANPWVSQTAVITTVGRAQGPETKAQHSPNLAASGHTGEGSQHSVLGEWEGRSQRGNGSGSSRISI